MIRARVWRILFATVLSLMPAAPAFAQEDDLDALLGDDRDEYVEPAAARETEPATQELAPPRKALPEDHEPAPRDSGIATTAPTQSSDEPAIETPARPGPTRIIEEIVVTAQKREQSLREVPISISVIDGELMKQEGITDFRDLSKFAGNVSMVVDHSAGDSFSGGPNIRIRGFGTAFGGDTFEQPVGMAIDGDSYSKLPLFLGGLFDVDRVEILKGPQGTLFGKNTTAGLVNMKTKGPTDEYSAFVDARLGSYDGRRFEGAVGGPVPFLQDLLRFRVAGVSDERDGWMENTTAEALFPNAPPPDRTEGGFERKGFRLKTDLPDLFGVFLKLSYERAQIDGFGTVAEWVRTDANPSPVNYFRTYDPRADFVRDNRTNSIDLPQFVTTRTRRFLANAEYDLAGWGLAGFAGITRFEVDSRYDGDGFPVPIGNVHNRTGQPQTNFELRLSSPPLPGLLGLDRILGAALGDSGFVAGFFYQRRDFEYFNDWLHSPFHILEYAEVLSTGEYPPVPPGSGTTPDPSTLAERPTLFSEEARSIAGFGQLTWRPLERWTLELGGRYTHESKDGSWNITQRRPQDNFWEIVGFTFFSTSAERSESDFTPRVSLIYDVTDDISVFATRAEGFKSGGLNANPSHDLPESLEYEPEEAVSWDVGTKTRLLGGAAMLDATLFWMEMTDLQVQTLESGSVPGTNQPLPIGAVFRVRNAGEARSRGLEVDATWLATEWLTLRGVLGLADTEYLDFPFGTCPNDMPNNDGDDIPQCDLTGRPFGYTPRWTATLTPYVRLPLRSIPGLAGLSSRHGVLGGIDLFGGPTVEYVDAYKASHAVDPRSRQPSFFRVHASFGLGDSARGWSLTIMGQNLTDEYTFDDVFFNMPHAKRITPAPPRMISGGFRWKF